MKPYYEDEWVTLYCGDCREVIPTLDPFDLVVTSPPYNLNEGDRNNGGTNWRRLENGYETYGDDLPHGEYVTWQREVVGMLWDGLSDTGAIFYNHKQICRNGVAKLPFELMPERAILRQVITWDHTRGHIRCAWYYVPRTEWLLLLAKPDFRINTLDVFDLWSIPSIPSEDHPASFPLKLAERAIRTTDAVTVLDPFAGSGTTLVAAKQLGRKAIGIEVNAAYCDIAIKRLSQGVLFSEAI